MGVKRIIGLVMASCMLMSTSVMAAEDESIKTEEHTIMSEEEAGESLQEISLSLQEPKEFNYNEKKTILSDKLEDTPQPYTTTPDDCEPNDTFQTAYPYNSVPIVKSELTSNNDLYGLGMRHAGLHSADDEDWYYTNLTAGQKYFVDLRNIGKTNWYIEVYYLRADQTGYYYTTDPEEMPVFEKWQEKYFYFTAQDTGKYYIRIANGGDWSDTMHYFFYVGPAVQYFDIVDMPTYGGTQIFANSYQTYTCDLRGVAVPATTAIVNLYMTDSFSQGKICSEVQKYMSAGGKTYYSPNGGTSNVIGNINGASLGQLWTIGGRCAKGTHFTYWSGRLNGRFACVMEPYPGNEVSF